MTKCKLLKFAELGTLGNVFQPKTEDFVPDGFFFKGKWSAGHFKNNHPLVLELGCGKGEYATGLAEKYPDKNFIGMDIKGDRLWRGGRTAIEKDLQNITFIRTQIENINYFFDKDEISEIWITFPDPQSNKPKIKKRLTSPQFLSRYKSILLPDAIIHLKTDNVPLFDYTLDVIKSDEHKLICETNDLYNSGIQDDILSIKTFYEKMFLKDKLPICYLKFQLKY